MTFQGKQFKLLYAAAFNRGNVDVFVDGNKIATINQYSASVVWQQSWLSPVLTEGVHTVKFVHAQSGRYADFDAITIDP